MSFSVSKVDGMSNIPNMKEYLLDNESDVALLPNMEERGKQDVISYSYNDVCSAGSIALVVSTGNKYILNNANKWVLLSVGSGSGGGSTISVSDELYKYVVANGYEGSKEEFFDGLINAVGVVWEKITDSTSSNMS